MSRQLTFLSFFDWFLGPIGLEGPPEEREAPPSPLASDPDWKMLENCLYCSANAFSCASPHMQRSERFLACIKNFSLGSSFFQFPSGYLFWAGKDFFSFYKLWFRLQFNLNYFQIIRWKLSKHTEEGKKSAW